MSWLSWFRPNEDVTEVVDADGPGHRKGERTARREQLYGVVRESMVNAGVLTSTYKLKVLSLDSRARQFLLMVDLAEQAPRSSAELAEIEAAIGQAANSRYGFMVKAVYWRQQRAPARAARGAPTPAAGRRADTVQA